ncbi:MAG: LPS assembly protein LptD [Lysobacteraceae bacterium]
MTFRSPLPAAGLSISLLAALASLHGGDVRAADDDWRLCSPGPLTALFEPLPDAGLPRESAPADIHAQRFNVGNQSEYHAEGDVELRRADQQLRAESLFYDTGGRSYRAEGDVRYQDKALLLTASRIEGELDADRTDVEDIRYQLVEARGNGEAARATMRGQVSQLEQVSYSTCDPRNPHWRISADEIELNQETGEGRARGAVLRLGKVPVFWLPYLSFPIDDRRRSGFLYPRIGTSDNTGLDISIPYYLNLAPNYDATLTLRSLGHRGQMFGGEFRYLGAQHRGEFSGSWLPDDNENGRDRGSFTWNHAGRLSDAWDLRINLNQVSDDRYFEDFGDSLSATSTSLLGSSAGVYGHGESWWASVALQAWDVTDPFVVNAQQPFRRLPRARFGWKQDWNELLEVGLRSELVAFDHETRPGARRIDLYPYLRMPLENSWGFLLPELGYRYTTYHLDSGYADPLGESTPDRGLPILSLDGGLLFERSTSLFGGRSIQTLEPRIYYLRAPYRDQSDLPIFDTRELTFSFDQLFRNNRFSGGDRQGDANQLTVAVSSSLFDEATGRERLRASIGQIHYFDAPRVGLPGNPPDMGDNSALVADLSSELSDRWRVGVTQQWDGDSHDTMLSGVRAQYRFRNTGVTNLAYRYRQNQLEQADLSFIAPVGERWRLVGRWNYSLQDSATLEAFAGIQWEDCCVAVRALARHYIRNREGDKNNGIYFEVELKGLGAFGRGAEELLERAILGYPR